MVENKQIQETEMVERLVNVSRVSKTVKGGRRMGLVALVVIGNRKGSIGIGKGKDKEASGAIKKATSAAKKHMYNFPLREGRTLHHDVEGKKGAGHVILRSAPPGTGIIAGGAVRHLMEALGVRDVVCKSIGSTNAYNLVWATIAALQDCTTARHVAMKRGKKVRDLSLFMGARSDASANKTSDNEEGSAADSSSKKNSD